MSKKMVLFMDVVLTVLVVIFTVLAGTQLVSIPPPLLDTPELELAEVQRLSLVVVCLMLSAGALLLRERLAAKYRNQNSSNP